MNVLIVLIPILTIVATTVVLQSSLTPIPTAWTKWSFPDVEPLASIEVLMVKGTIHTSSSTYIEIKATLLSSYAEMETNDIAFPLPRTILLYPSWCWSSRSKLQGARMIPSRITISIIRIANTPVSFHTKSSKNPKYHTRNGIPLRITSSSYVL